MTRYGEGWWHGESRIDRPVDEAVAAARFRAGQAIAMEFAAATDVRAHAVHDPSRDYLVAGFLGWPDDPGNRSSLRFETVGPGTFALAEVTAFQEVPDPVLGDRAIRRQSVRVTNRGGRHATLDLDALGVRLIRSLADDGTLDALAALRFEVRDLDGYRSLVRPDLVVAALLAPEAFDTARPDVREHRFESYAGFPNARGVRPSDFAPSRPSSGSDAA